MNVVIQIFHGFYHNCVKTITSGKFILECFPSLLPGPVPIQTNSNKISWNSCMILTKKGKSIHIRNANYVQLDWIQLHFFGGAASLHIGLPVCLPARLYARPPVCSNQLLERFRLQYSSNHKIENVVFTRLRLSTSILYYNGSK